MIIIDIPKLQIKLFIDGFFPPDSPLENRIDRHRAANWTKDKTKIHKKYKCQIHSCNWTQNKTKIHQNVIDRYRAANWT